ncbi:hypothetical protein ACH5RR_010841 [Cinchona calisaya]|uniref:Uncharacterized protein n=1 Tax=Cinchona calisaya TaxID=153742 RepID=A0ABD3AK31_9GENT
MVISCIANNNGDVDQEIPTHNTGAAINIVTNNDNDKTASLYGEDKEKKKKKKSGAFSFFRAALLAMRSDSKKKEVVPPKSNEKWKKIVGSMRPLHLQENQSPPPSLPPPSPARTAESLEDLNLIQQPSSPAPSSVSGGTMSQYASASNLQELDNEESDPDEVFDAICGDEMIDAKAEEFIAQFYQQMKLQQHVGTMIIE